MRQSISFLAIATLAAALAGCQEDRTAQNRNANGSADAAQAAAAQQSPGITNDADKNIQPDAATTQPSKSPDIRNLNRFD